MNSEICTSEVAKENPELLVRISCALLEAADYRSEHIEDIAEAVAKVPGGQGYISHVD